MKFLDSVYAIDIDLSKLSETERVEVETLAKTNAHRLQSLAETYEQRAILAEFNAADDAEPKIDRRFLARNRRSIPARRRR